MYIPYRLWKGLGDQFISVRESLTSHELAFEVERCPRPPNIQLSFFKKKDLIRTTMIQDEKITKLELKAQTTLMLKK